MRTIMQIVEQIIGFSVITFIFITVGFFFALPTRLPQRKVYRKGIRRILAGTLFVITTLVVFVVIMWYLTTVALVYIKTLGAPGLNQEIVYQEINVQAVTNDVMWRALLFNKEKCFSDDAAVCEMADWMMQTEYSVFDYKYTVMTLLSAMISGFSAMFFTWRFTGPIHKQKNDAVSRAEWEHPIIG